MPQTITLRVRGRRVKERKNAVGKASAAGIVERHNGRRSPAIDDAESAVKVSERLLPADRSTDGARGLTVAGKAQPDRAHW